MDKIELFTKEIGRIDEDSRIKFHDLMNQSTGDCFKRIRFLGIIHAFLLLLIFAGTVFSLYYVDEKGFIFVCIAASFLGVLSVYSLCKSLKKAIVENRKKETKIYEDAITEISDVAAQERKNDRLKNGYIKELSYEVKAPVDSVFNLVEKIFKYSTEYKTIENAAKIKGVMAALQTYVDDLCVSSTQGLEHLEITNGTYDLGIMICDIENAALKVADEKGITLAFEINNDTPAILRGDSVHIELIILKLISNALKYTEEGTVTFSVGYLDASPTEINLNISVKDTGQGIKAEDMDKYFSDSKTPTEALLKGCSLSMCMAKALLEKMGSELRVESKLTQGSEFHFVIKQEVVERIPLGNREDAIKRMRDKDISARSEKIIIPQTEDTPEETPAPDNDFGFIKKIEAMEEINLAEGIENTGSAELYRKVVKEFCDSAPDKADSIENYRKNKDTKNYTVEVHALKSAAGVIGYKKLSKLAEALEDAGKENDFIRIDNATGELIKLYRGIADKIKNAESAS